MNYSLAVMVILSVFTIGVFSCTPENKELDEFSKVAESRDMGSGNPDIETEYWSGDIDDDCQGEGDNCLVITGDSPEQKLVRDNDWDQLFNSGSTTYGLDQSLVNGIFDGSTSVYTKKRDNDLLIRLKK